MSNNLVHVDFDESLFVNTSHGIGQKFVFCTEKQCESKLTQAAIGILKVGEDVESHIHPTMEEFFFFNSGNVDFSIGEYLIKAIGGTFVRIPAGVPHSLKIMSDSNFIYWGIAI